LPVTPNRSDPRIELALCFHDLCRFHNFEENVRQLEQAIASPAPELRPLLEAAGLLATSPEAKMRAR
jgi:hypothetical protein